MDFRVSREAFLRVLTHVSSIVRHVVSGQTFGPHRPPKSSTSIQTVVVLEGFLVSCSDAVSGASCTLWGPTSLALMSSSNLLWVIPIKSNYMSRNLIIRWTSFICTARIFISSFPISLSLGIAQGDCDKSWRQNNHSILLLRWFCHLRIPKRHIGNVLW